MGEADFRALLLLYHEGPVAPSELGESVQCPTDQQILSIACPTRVLEPGEPCIWNSGGLGLGAHLNCKLSALDVVELGELIDSVTPMKRPNEVAVSALACSLPFR